MKKILCLSIISLLLIAPFNVLGITISTFDKNITIQHKDAVTASFDEEFDLLIITDASFASSLGSFVGHKRNRNLSTILVTTADIYLGSHFIPTGVDNIEKIKYFIKNAIENWDISYVLLIGDTTLIPVRYSKNGFTALEKEFPTDLYYADIYITNNDGSKVFATWDADGDRNYGEFPDDNSMVDLYPDICLGRLPCKNDQEAKSVIDKIKDFEQNSHLQKPVNKILQLGGDTYYYDDYPEHEGEQSNIAVLDALQNSTKNNYQSISLWASLENLTKNNIDNVFSEGIDFVDFSGHGAPDRWFTYAHCDKETELPEARSLFDESGFTNDDASRLINKKLPIAVICSCLCGQFTSDDCLAWALLKNKNGGSIASFAHSGLGIFNDPHSGGTVLDRWAPWLQVKIFEELTRNGILGEVWRSSICGYIDYWKQFIFDQGDYRTVETLTLIGDPSLNDIGDSYGDNNPPEKPTIIGPISVEVGKVYTYNLTCNDPDNDDVLFYIEWGDSLTDNWLDHAVSGETIEKTHIWSFPFPRTRQIKVKAKDKYEAESEWTYLDITITKETRDVTNGVYRIIEMLTKNFKYAFSINNC